MLLHVGEILEQSWNEQCLVSAVCMCLVMHRCFISLYDATSNLLQAVPADNHFGR